MESRGEASELQQLVSSDVDGENDDSTIQDDTITENEGKTMSPVRSNRVGVRAKRIHRQVRVYFNFLRYLLREIPVTVRLIVAPAEG